MFVRPPSLARRLRNALRTRALRPATTVATAAALAFAAGCGGSSDPVQPLTPSPLPYTISGTLRNVSGATVPSDARVVLVWAGDKGNGDYSYAWGSGPVDVATGRFTVTFTQAPPDSAVLGVDKSGTQAGVAFPVLVRAADVGTGLVTDQQLYQRALGAAGRHAVIYVKGTLPGGIGWTGMRQGYNVGRGVPAKAGQTFDTFEAVDPSTIDLVVDALQNINVVNWT